MSLSELAESLDVSRQALSSWENGKKQIPEKRREQLSKFFGIDAKYFGEISDSERQEVYDKAMFRYTVGDKEKFLFRRAYMPKDVMDILTYFPEEREITLDEEFIKAKEYKKRILSEIEEEMDGPASCDYLSGKISCIEKTCKSMERVMKLIKHRTEYPRHLRVYYGYELINISKAMLMALGIQSEEELVEYPATEENNWCGEDVDYIKDLAEVIKKHWEYVSSREVDRFNKAKQNRIKNLEVNKDSQQVQIEKIEEDIKKMKDNDSKASILFLRQQV